MSFYLRVFGGPGMALLGPLLRASQASIRVLLRCMLIWRLEWGRICSQTAFRFLAEFISFGCKALVLCLLLAEGQHLSS